MEHLRFFEYTIVIKLNLVYMSRPEGLPLFITGIILIGAPIG